MSGSSSTLEKLVASELNTDRYGDDVTVRLLGEDASTPAEAVAFAKEKGVFCGKEVVDAFRHLGFKAECLVSDGDTVEKGTEVARIKDTLGSCLGAERTLLNLLSHLSGVATLTRRYVDAAKPHRVRILATRKTLPGLRDLQLKAVRAGGGYVHRRSLSDGILVKDNHLAFMAEEQVVTRANRVKAPLHRVEVEVQSIEQLKRLLKSPPDVVMLDNLNIEQMKEAIGLIAGRCEIEVSGGVSLDSVPALAELGVDYISVGRLTHSAPALDLSMDIRKVH